MFVYLLWLSSQKVPKCFLFLGMFWQLLKSVVWKVLSFQFITRLDCFCYSFYENSNFFFFWSSLRWCWFSTEFSCLLVMLLICGERVIQPCGRPFLSFLLSNSNNNDLCTLCSCYRCYSSRLSKVPVKSHNFESFFLYVCALLLHNLK